MAKKPEILHEPREVQYDDEHWSILSELRAKAIQVMQTLESIGVRSFVYGSVARGDITKTSDVDIIIPYTLSSYKIEVVLGQGLKRELVQATPSMVLKGHIYLEDSVTISFPLFKMMSREEEFYRWGGAATFQQLQDGERISGVDKRLLLIEPTPSGHIERGTIGHESEVAKRVGVSIGIAQERVRVLTRRDNVGRTGVYLTHRLSPDESFESVAKSLQDSDPALRRTIERRTR
ncbi:MAG: nucleotidyltransferase domain-containing protein [Candidatus Thorarchaeota archaeon]